MVTFAELRRVAALKKWSRSQGRVWEWLVPSAALTRKNMDWLIALIERETDVTCEADQIEALRIRTKEARHQTPVAGVNPDDFWDLLK